MKRLRFAVIIVLFGALLSFLLVQHRAQLQLSAENNALREQLVRLSEAQNSSAVNLTQNNSTNSLSNDQFHELLRLRGEVALLRSQQSQAQTRPENLPEQNHPSDSATFSPDGKLITTNSDGTVRVWDLANAQELLPKEQWAFAGYADPESALKTVTWAMSKGDLKTTLASLAPDEAADVRQKFEGKPQSDMAAETADIASVRILKKEAISDDEVVLTLYADGTDAKDQVVRLKFQRFGNEWKMAGKAPDKQ